MSAAKRTEAGEESTGASRDASTKTTVPRTAAREIEAAMRNRFRRRAGWGTEGAAASTAEATPGCLTGAISRYPRFRIVSTYCGLAVSSPNARRSSRIARCSTSSDTKTPGHTFVTSCSRVTTSPGVSASASSTCITFGSTRTSSVPRVSRFSDGCASHSPTLNDFTPSSIRTQIWGLTPNSRIRKAVRG